MGKIRNEDILGMGIGSLSIHGIFKESQIAFLWVEYTMFSYKATEVGWGQMMRETKRYSFYAESNGTVKRF